MLICPPLLGKGGKLAYGCLVPSSLTVKVIFAKSCFASPITWFKVLTSSEVLFKLWAKSIDADLIDAADWRLPWISI